MLNAGNYIAEVKYVSLETLETKTGQNYPVIKVTFAPQSIRNGSVFTEGTFPLINKLYFLSEELVKSGPNAGQSRIELLRKGLQDTYDYSGGLDPNELNQIVGKKVEIVVRPQSNGFMEVAFVNKVGGRAPREGKAISPELLSKLNAAFKGQKSEGGAPADPSKFFLQLKGLNPNG